MKHVLPAIALIVALPAAAADPALKEGQWEMTTTMKIPGMQMPELPEGVELPPGVDLNMSGPTVTHKMCVTKENMVPADQNSGDDCKMENLGQSGNTIKWKVACNTDDGNMVGEGTATYTGDTMKSVIKMKGTSSGQSINMTNTTTGKYLGPCPTKG